KLDLIKHFNMKYFPDDINIATEIHINSENLSANLLTYENNNNSLRFPNSENGINNIYNICNINNDSNQSFNHKEDLINDQFNLNKTDNQILNSEKQIIDFFRLVNICNSIVIDYTKSKNQEINYQSISIDELAL